VLGVYKRKIEKGKLHNVGKGLPVFRKSSRVERFGLHVGKKNSFSGSNEKRNFGGEGKKETP